jgi:hypothetical protein
MHLMNAGERSLAMSSTQTLVLSGLTLLTLRRCWHLHMERIQPTPGQIVGKSFLTTNNQEWHTDRNTSGYPNPVSMGMGCFECCTSLSSICLASPRTVVPHSML